MRYRNATYGFIEGLRGLLSKGKHVHVRGSDVLELRNHVTIIDNPLERCIVTPRRSNNIFAAIAETAWVMGGRNDLAYLSHYLPRAVDFSDDGATWRAAYGPRLRSWHGVDQVKEVVRLLRAELETRRAVMAIFDPAVDYVDSKDIPCNNWLDWLVRDGKLHLSIALRSNDAVWGFSGINSFEWSVLQEMMAYWCGVEVGDVTFFASSFHLYDHHNKRAHEIVDAFPEVTCYELGLTSPRFATSWEAFDDVLRQWFEIELRLRVEPEKLDKAIADFPDPLFGHFLAMLQLYNGMLLGWSDKELHARLMKLPETDLTTAAYEYFGRTRPNIITDSSAHLTIMKLQWQWQAAATTNRPKTAALKSTKHQKRTKP